MSYTRSESERLARLRCTTGGIVCRYKKYIYEGVTGPTGPTGATSFPTIVSGSTGAMLILGSTGGAQTVQSTTLLQASQQAYPNNAAPATPYLRVTGDIIPSQTNTYNLGNTGIQFKSAYFSGNTIYLDNVPIGSTGGNTLVFPTDIQLGNTLINISGGDTLILPDKVQFRSGGTLTSGTQGTTGPTGPPDASANQWIERNARAQSPAVVFETVTTTSSAIYIPWKYPEQERLAFINIWVPATNNVSATVSYIPAGGSITTAAPFTAASGSQYIDIDGVRYTNVNLATHITGIILSSVAAAGTGYLSNVVFPHDGKLRNAHRFYNPSFAALDPNSTINVTVWYSNFSTAAPNQASVVCNIFLQPTGPSAPQNVVGAATGVFSGNIQGTPPVRGETGDANSTATITRYEFAYSTPGSTQRYGGPLSQAGTATFVGAGAPSFSQALTGLVPDATYTVSAAAVNSFGITGATAGTSFTTLPPAQPADITGTIDPAATYSGTFNIVAGGGTTSIAPAVLVKGTIGTRVSTTPIVAPIHATANRGSATAAIAKFGAALLDAGVTGPKAEAVYDGFPAKAYATVTSSVIDVSGGISADTGGPQAGSTGFYLTVPTAAAMTLGNNGVIVASPNPYVLRLLQSRSSPQVDTSIDLPFRYDGPPQPSVQIVSATDNINNSTSLYVSGIQVVTQFNNYQITTVADNMSGYYFKTPLITYVSAVPSAGVVNTNETSLVNLTDGSFTTPAKTQLLSQITCIRPNIPFTLPAATYFTQLNIDVTVQNAVGSAVSRITRNLVVDEPSRIFLTTLTKYRNTSVPPVYDPVNSQLTGLIGNHISSGISRGKTGAATNIHVPDFSDNTVGFMHDSTLIGTEELQIYNGLFSTPPYLDYSSHFLNSGKNYASLSSPTGYRYATFAWGFKGSVADSGIGLTIHVNGPNMSNQLFIGSDNYAHIGSASGPLLELYYRIADKTSIYPTDIKSYTTIWANANNRLNELTSGTYYFPADNSVSKGGLTSNPIIIGNTKASFTVAVPSPINSDALIFVRIGGPTSHVMKFESITIDIVNT